MVENNVGVTCKIGDRAVFPLFFLLHKWEYTPGFYILICFKILG